MAKSKRIIASILTLCMLFSICPTSVFAADTADTEPPDNAGTLSTELSEKANETLAPDLKAEPAATPAEKAEEDGAGEISAQTQQPPTEEPEEELKAPEVEAEAPLEDAPERVMYCTYENDAWKENYQDTYETVTNTTTQLTEGWWVVNGNVAITITLQVFKNVHLILTDGCSLVINNNGLPAIDVYGTLTVYGQSKSTGKLTATASNGDGFSSGPLNIQGGTIEAIGKGMGYAIGSNLTVNPLFTVKAGADASSATEVQHNGSPNVTEKNYVSIAPPTFTVTWKNGEATLATDTLSMGEVPAYTGVALTKANDETLKKGYIFAGWTDKENGTTAKTLTAVTADTTYYAVFTEVPLYTITWMNNTTQLAQTLVKQGDIPVYPYDENPTKASTAVKTFSFSGWTDNLDYNDAGTPLASIPAATKDEDYFANFTAAVSAEYSYPVYNTPGEPASGIASWEKGTVSAEHGDDIHFLTVMNWDRNSAIGTAGKTEWWIVDGTVDFNLNTVLNLEGIKIRDNATVNLLLTDGSYLHPRCSGGKSGILVGKGATLNIYSNSLEYDKMGKLYTAPYSGTWAGGIDMEDNANLTINGGRIEAISDNGGTAIGPKVGKCSSYTNTIIINGGDIYAKGTFYGIGIEKGTLIINGGVTAESNTVKSAEIIATGRYFAVGAHNGGTAIYNAKKLAMGTNMKKDIVSAYAYTELGEGNKPDILKYTDEAGKTEYYEYVEITDVTYHNVNVAAVSNGTASVVPTRTIAGKPVTVSTSAADEYLAESISVSMKGGTATVNVKNPVFTMQDSDATVRVDFVSLDSVGLAVTYLEPDLDANEDLLGWQQKRISSTQSDVTLIDGDDTYYYFTKNDETTKTHHTYSSVLENGWYLLRSENKSNKETKTINIAGLVVNGDDVNLIIPDGYELYIENAITVNAGKKLTVYASSVGSNKGILTVAGSRGTNDIFQSAIGSGGDGQDAGTIVINGGKLNVDNKWLYPTIGGENAKIIINGGEIAATHTDNYGSGSYDYLAPAIGGKNSNIRINGGTVNAQRTWGANVIGGDSATITVAGGTVMAGTAKQKSNGHAFEKEALIGGLNANITIKGGTVRNGEIPNECGGIIGIGGTCAQVTITGGTVDVKGGYAGIGGVQPIITISGGNVTASGIRSDGLAAGIGGSGLNTTWSSDASKKSGVTISGGTVIATGGDYGAGIGSGGSSESGEAAGNITISGGTVTANGGRWAAGIGSGINASVANITISGGTVTAVGKGDETGGGAGIGGGYHSSASDITIEGGTVVARGAYSSAGIGSSFTQSATNITISGGSVYAVGGVGGAGIGTGSDYSEGTSVAGNITISGGDVTANGGSSKKTMSGGAGIGSGAQSEARGITISGGKVTAYGGYGSAGIGSGTGEYSYSTLRCSASDITISGGTVTAVGGSTDGLRAAAGIGGDEYGAGQNITIDGTVNQCRVVAVGGTASDAQNNGSLGGPGIGGGSGSVCANTSYNITIKGENVSLTAVGGVGKTADGDGIGTNAYIRKYGNFENYANNIFIEKTAANNGDTISPLRVLVGDDFDELHEAITESTALTAANNEDSTKWTLKTNEVEGTAQWRIRDRAVGVEDDIAQYLTEKIVVIGEAAGTIPHVHAWGYSASGASIIAGCSGDKTHEPCDIPAGENNMVTIVWDNAIGRPVLDADTLIGQTSLPAIIYKGENYNSASFPTQGGEYRATLTVGTAEASYSFTIETPSTATAEMAAENVVTHVQYATLKAALEAANPGEKIWLLKNVTENNTVTKDVVIDLNGKTLTSVDYDKPALKVTESANLTLKDSTGGGKITASSTLYAGKAIGIENAGTGTVTVQSGAIEVSGYETYGILLSASKAKLIVNGGTITATNPASTLTSLPVSKCCDAITLFDGSTATVNGGTVTATSVSSIEPVGIRVKSGATLKVNGGTITATASGTAKAYGIYSDAKVSVSGGSLSADGSLDAYALYQSSTADATIDGGSFVAKSLVNATVVFNEGNATVNDGSFEIVSGVTLKEGHTLDGGTLIAQYGGKLTLNSIELTEADYGLVVDSSNGVNADVTINGQTFIRENTKANVLLKKGQTLKVGNFGTVMQVGITTEDEPVPGTPVLVTAELPNPGSSDLAKYVGKRLLSDNSDYTASLSDNNELRFIVTHDHSGDSVVKYDRAINQANVGSIPWVDNGLYVLTEDVRLSAEGNIEIPSGITVTICMNGHIIDLNQKGSIINNGTLIIGSCENNAIIENGKGTNILNNGTLTIDNVLITEAKYDSTTNGEVGCGICSSGTLTLTNCAVNYNDNRGLKIKGGTLTMTDCEVENNIKSGTFHYGGIAITGTDVKATLTNCSIRSNSNKSTNDQNVTKGGGIYSVAQELTLNTCTVTGNEAEVGDGVYATNLTVTGNTVIESNKKSGTNLYLDGTTFSIVNPGSGMSIGVTTATAPAAGASVKLTGNNGADYSAYVHSDNAAYTVQNSANNELELVAVSLSLSLTITTQPTLDRPTVEVSYTPAAAELSYQWYKNTTNSTEGGTPVVNQIGNTLSFDAPATGAGPDYYYCKVSASYDSKIETVTTDVIEVKSDSHIHNWTYTAEGNVITASCDVNGCTYSGTDKTLTINAVNVTYDGKAHAATLSYADGCTTLAGVGSVDESSIEYYQADTKLDSAPVNAGTYTAKITVGGVTAETSFTIAKATLTAADFSVSDTKQKYFNDHKRTVTVSTELNGTGTRTVKYYVGNSEVPETTDAGTYTVKLDVAEGENYKAAADLTDPSWVLIIEKLDVEKDWFTVTKTENRFYNGKAQTENVSMSKTKNGIGEYELVYYKTDGDASVKVAQPCEIGTYRIDLVVSEGSNYKAATFTNVGTINITQASHDNENHQWTYEVDPADPESIIAICVADGKCPYDETAEGAASKRLTVHANGKRTESNEAVSEDPVEAKIYNKSADETTFSLVGLDENAIKAIKVQYSKLTDAAKETYTPQESAPKGNEEGDYKASITVKYGDNNTEVTAASKYTIIHNDTGHSLTLDGSVGLNFYVDSEFYLTAEEKDEGAYIVLNYNQNTTSYSTTKTFGPKAYFNAEKKGENDVLATAASDTDSRIKLSATVTPAQIMDTIECYIYKADGTLVNKHEYTVAAYCKAVIGMETYSKAEENSNEKKLYNLCGAILDYGSSCQQYFGYNYNAQKPAETLANGNDFTRLNTVDTTGRAFGDDGDVPGMCIGVAFMALTNSAVEFYFEKTGNVGTATIDAEFEKIEGVKVNIGTNTLSSTPLWYASVEGIPAAKLGTEFTITITDVANKNKESKFTGSALSYARLVIKQNAENPAEEQDALDFTNQQTKTEMANLVTLCKALISYGNSAAAYFKEAN